MILGKTKNYIEINKNNLALIKLKLILLYNNYNKTSNIKVEYLILFASARVTYF